jgi:hypothetical protein
MADEHAGETDQRQGAEQNLRGHADRHLAGHEVRDVGRRVVDLDADEDGAGGCGAEAGGRGDAVAADVHGGLLWCRCRAGCPAMSTT